MSTIDDLVSPEMRIQYLSKKKSETAECMISVQQREFKSSSHLGHKLKGNASSFGFEDLGILGDQLEVAANKMDLENSKSILLLINKYIEEAKI